jgi:hypothetical protein
VKRLKVRQIPKKFCGRVLALLAMFSHLSAQEEEPLQEQESFQETGSAAMASAEEAIDNNWQNWTVFAITLVLAAGAIYVVSIDSGHGAS